MNTACIHTAWVNPAYVSRIYVDRPYAAIDKTHQYEPYMHKGGVYVVNPGEYYGNVTIDSSTRGLNEDALAIIAEYEKELASVQTKFDDALVMYRLNYTAPARGPKRPWWRRVF